MTLAMREHLVPPYAILNDRAAPGTTKNIDHVVVVRSGVWVIDDKNWQYGDIEYKNVGGFAGYKMRLFVGGKNETGATDSATGLAMRVAKAIGNPAINVIPALAFVNGGWVARQAVRLMVTKKPYIHEGVRIGSPLAIISAMNAPGILDEPAIERLREHLDGGLPPYTSAPR